MKVLVIDDDQEVQGLLKTFLTSEGHEVELGSSGVACIEKVKTLKPDLLLLDIRLPDANGNELLKKVKSADPEQQVVMVTGFKEAESVVEAFRLGAMDCLLKPFNFDYLKFNILPKVKIRNA